MTVAVKFIYLLFWHFCVFVFLYCPFGIGFLLVLSNFREEICRSMRRLMEFIEILRRLI
ncbi:unnamed protein product [Meloidogyne enterolobii]|uniref:Uncharacterized protein n=1 Tax=Meloidogyne enterolobii TaxID=390850 RepID=A0ACB0YQJ0_MELEN